MSAQDFHRKNFTKWDIKTTELQNENTMSFLPDISNNVSLKGVSGITAQT